MENNMIDEIIYFELEHVKLRLDKLTGFIWEWKTYKKGDFSPPDMWIPLKFKEDDYGFLVCNINKVKYLKHNIIHTALKNRVKKPKGYHWDKKAKKWRAQLSIKGRTVHIGMYETEKEAHQGYLIAKKVYRLKAEDEKEAEEMKELQSDSDSELESDSDYESEDEEELQRKKEQEEELQRKKEKIEEIKDNKMQFYKY